MTLSDTRKHTLVDTYGLSGSITTGSLLNAILADLNSSTANTADVEWLYSVLGTVPLITIPSSTYTGIPTGYINATVISIVNGNTIEVVKDCPEGQLCTLVSSDIQLRNVPASASSKSWLDLHVTPGARIAITQATDGSYQVIHNGENINDSLNTYLSGLLVTPVVSGTSLNATVSEIVDGDTIEVVKECLAGQLCNYTPLSIRLNGISASELSFPSGKTAKEWIATLIPVGSKVSLTVLGTDAYGRYLSTVYNASGNDINQQMINDGQAKTYVPTAESIDGKVRVTANCGSTIETTSNSLQFISPICNKVKNGNTVWFGYTVKNVSSNPWKGWAGIVLYDGNGNSYEYTGDPSKPSVIQPGVTKNLFAKFLVPTSLGTITSWYFIPNVSQS